MTFKRPTGSPSRDPSGQQPIFDKSHEEELETPHGQQVECLGRIFPDDNARREHFLNALREKLQDPDFRKTEGFPISTEEAILALSDPPYHTACPNPFLEKFLEQYGKPYDPTVPYSKDYTINHVPPVMLHHVTRELTRQREESADKKVALVLVDGMAISQWLVVRDVLQAQRPGLHFQERAVFAWIPTITAVSRQAAFAAKPPLYFPESIYSTDEDAAQWELFWSDHGLTNWGSMYIRGLGERGLDKVTEMASHPSLRAFGLVVDKIDKIMHGMTLGMDGMLAQVRQWAEKGYLARLLGILLDRGFAVTVTSDHGNIEAVGCGNPSEGAIADIRGERVRVFSDECLLAGVQERFPDALPWLPVGLPEGYLPLLAPGRLAFVSEGDRIVAHGGMSLEEVVVPLIQVTRKAQ